MASSEPEPARKRARTDADADAGDVRKRLAQVLLCKGSVEKLAAIGELTDDALALAAASGVVMYKAPAAKAQATVVPLALLPTPVDAGLYAEAVAMAPAFHRLMDAVACDWGWLQEALRETAKLDAICAGLLDIGARVYGPGGRDYSKDFRLHIMRNDFMLDSASEKRGQFALKQIEINMIAASFATHAQDVTELHRHLLCKYLHRVDETLSPEVLRPVLRDAVPASRATQGFAAALAEAHKAYEARWPRQGAAPGRALPRAVLFLTVDAENNELDHRKLESALFRDHGIIALRRSLAQLCETGASKLVPNRSGSAPGPRALVVDGHEVTVAYFRTGYWPENYQPAAECWAVREAIEASDATKCPSVPAQLAGMKKVQQLLSEPAVLSRFVPDAHARGAALLRRTFARLGDPGGDSEEARACVRDALADPSAWVLKPQVEGSGELFFNEDIPRVLNSRTKSELAEFILMERIWPPVTPSIVVHAKEGETARAEAAVRESVAELGVFGVLAADGGRTVSNEAVGHLLRSKAHSTLQGGVFVGNAVVDAPLLLPASAFWASLPR